VKQLAKNFLFRVAPRLATAMMSARARAHSHRVVADWGGGAVSRKLIARFGTRVQEGPFAGTVLTPMTHAEQIGPYLLGVYESELDPAWEILLRGTYRQIIDIGAKFGYYAVGLARRYPDAAVVAFDTDWWARKAVRQMAAANDTPNVEVSGQCDPEALVRTLRAPAFILSDCEGYEAVLFGPDVIQALASATLLIETHDSVVPGISEGLRAAFSGTHDVVEYGASAARRTTTRVLDFLSEAERQLALHEVRGRQRWLLCLPKEGDNQQLRLLRGA
jgi:hypothetical protein